MLKCGPALAHFQRDLLEYELMSDGVLMLEAEQGTPQNEKKLRRVVALISRPLEESNSGYSQGVNTGSVGNKPNVTVTDRQNLAGAIIVL